MTELDAIARRPAEYLSETGLPQLTSGLVLCFLGSSILILRFLPGTDLYRLGVPWIGNCGAAAVLLGIAAIKRKIVFPRGGYVAPLGRTTGSVYLGLILVLGVAMWAVLGTSSGHRFDLLESRIIWPGAALVFAVLCLSTVGKPESAPATCFGIWLICVAPLLWWLPITNYERSACLQVAAGAPLAAAGAVRLRRFLQRNPAPPGLPSE